MRALDQKRITTVLSVLIFLFFLLIGIAFASWYTLQNNANLERGESRIVIAKGETDHFRDGKVYRALPAGSYALSVTNEGKNETEIRLYFSDRVTVNSVVYEAYSPVTVRVPAEAAARLEFQSGAECDFGFAEDNTSFVFDRESFKAARAWSKAGSDLVFLKETAFTELQLERPLRLFGAFTFERCTLQTNLSGRAVVCPDREQKAAFSVYAPELDFYTRDVEFAFEERLTDYYFTVKTLNGEKRDLSYFPVANFTMLSELSKNAAFLSDERPAVVDLVETFVLKIDVSFDRAFSLTLSAPFETGDKVLSMHTLSEAALTVKLGEGTALAPENLEYDAPNCDLVWESALPPILERIEQTQNLRSYNGELCSLGGLGVGEVRLSLPAGSVPGVEGRVEFRRTGNLLVADLPYSVTMEQLSEVRPEIESECRVYFESKKDSGAVDLSASPILILQDDNGNFLRLRVKILRRTKNLPVLYIETEGGADVETKEQYLSATFTLDAGKSGFESIPLTHIRIRGRGNSTWEWPKKPYKIHFDEAVSVFGLAPAEEWALLANYADKSLMRNHVALEMAKTLSFDYTPTQNAVDVFLNGDYLGVYSFGEHLEAGEGRVEVEQDMNKVDCGYFLEVGGVVSGVDVLGKNYFHAGLLKFILVKSPEFEELTKEQFDFIKEYMMDANKAVVAGEGYEEYLDVDSVIDWIIMTELTNNTDCAYRRSCYFTKDAGGKLKMGPVWDFDLAFGNFSRDIQDYSAWATFNMDDDYVGETWTYHLFKDPAFQARFKARWNEVRESLLETAENAIDDEYQRILPSAEENFRVWDILGRKVAFERKDTTKYPTYESQITYLKTFLKNRAAWIDEQIRDW